MNDAADDNLLHYFKRELSYLREQGSDFAQRYPNVASSLALHGDQTLDPHVERLIEATAFLAARVHRDLDQSFPQVPEALLANVCPSLGQPVPSMTVARMALDPAQGKVTAGYRVPRHTGLQVHTPQGELCRFRTAWDATLWPVQVIEAMFDDPQTLRMTLATGDDTDFAELEIETLRFHLHGDWTETMPLYDLLTSSLHRIDIYPEATPSTNDADASASPPLSGALSGFAPGFDSPSPAGRPVAQASASLPPSAWQEVGFAPEETVLAPPDHAYLPYTLLQEFFAFPRKFLFFDLVVPRGALGKGRRVDIELRLRANGDDAHFATASTSTTSQTSTQRGLPALCASNFVLGCVPAINLFPRTSEPIVADQRHYEYPLVGDRRHHAHTEIYAILSVIGSDPSTDRKTTIPPLNGSDADFRSRAPSPMMASNPPSEHGPAINRPDAATRKPASAVRWSARREHALRPDLSGTEVFLAFVDQDSAPLPPRTQTVYASLLCTNRRLAEHVVRGAPMALEGVSRHVRVQCLYAPTPQSDPPLGSATLWRLVSLLTVNYQSLLNAHDRAGQTGASPDAAWLHDLLTLFTTQGERHQKQVHGIRDVSSRPTTAHIGQDGWRGFCRGTEITLQFERENFVGSSPLLLGAVLSRFFAMYTSINAFVRVVARGRDDVWKQWPAMSGLQQLL